MWTLVIEQRTWYKYRGRLSTLMYFFIKLIAEDKYKEDLVDVYIY